MKSVTLLCIALLSASNLFGVLVPFERITANSNFDIAGQLILNLQANDPVEVQGQWFNKVTFMFVNNGPVASSITEIYFYDGSLLSMYSIDETCPGVDFKNIGAATDPATLPGYNPDPTLVAVLSAAEANNPESKKGVKATEWIKIGYTLQADKTFEDLLHDLATGEVVVGIHVKAIEQTAGGTASDSFISVVPEPATLALLGLGGLLLRKRK